MTLLLFSKIKKIKQIMSFPILSTMILQSKPRRGEIGQNFEKGNMKCFRIRVKANWFQFQICLVNVNNPGGVQITVLSPSTCLNKIEKNTKQTLLVIHYTGDSRQVIHHSHNIRSLINHCNSFSGPIVITCFLQFHKYFE